MYLKRVYLGLGGNIGDSAGVIRRTVSEIALLSCIKSLRMSKLYVTTPVSDIPQADYVNGVCCFDTTMSLHHLYCDLHEIELAMGKTGKEKNAPRVIDIDILFYGEQSCDHEMHIVPHPRWRERLFVLRPLSDLTDQVFVPGEGGVMLIDLLKDFPNIHNEVVETVNCIHRESFSLL